MTAAITLTPLPDAAPPRVTITGTESAPTGITQVTVYRKQGSDPELYQLYQGPSLGSAWTMSDLEAPFGVTLTYWVDVNRSGAIDRSNFPTTTLSPAVPRCWLSDRASGVAMPVTIVDWRERLFRSRAISLPVIDRADPVVLVGKHLLPSGTVTFGTQSQNDLRQLQTILMSSAFVLLRPDASCSMVWGYQAVGDVGESRRAPHDCESWQFLTPVQVQQVGALPGAARYTTATLGRLAAKYPPPATLQTLANTYPTLLALSLDPLV